MSPRVLLVMPARTYRAAAFLSAGHRLGLEMVVASEEGSTLGHLHPERELVIDLADPVGAAEVAAKRAVIDPISAVVPVDEAAVLAAAHIAERLGIRSSPVRAVAATRNKLTLRERLGPSRVSQPSWWLWAEGAGPGPVTFPCVAKPLDQAASRGVIRANNEPELLAAGQRIRRLLAADPDCPDPPGGRSLLVEEFVAGPEFAVEALLVDGALRVLAVCDKPEPLDGPFFEETIYTVPSTLEERVLTQLGDTVQEAARALGLSQGAIHAELRLGSGRPVLIDLASRTIGGSCSRVLHFSSGRTLEEIVLLAALGEDPGVLELEAETRGVMMMAIPKSGRLRSMAGRPEVLARPSIDGVEVPVPIGGEVVPLPEGDRYLGFIFAHGPSAEVVSADLWDAYHSLEIVIEG
jgi:biotin carboxylase